MIYVHELANIRYKSISNGINRWCIYEYIVYVKVLKVKLSLKLNVRNVAFLFRVRSAPVIRTSLHVNE